MRVLVGCEFSGTVRDAFTARGHDAMSCDLLPSEAPGQHYQGDVFDIIDQGWDLAIFHPPCTYLSGSGMRWLYETPKKPRPGVLYEEARREAKHEALEFVRRLLAADIPRIALENPVSIISSQVRKPDQTIQPWQFGHGERKATCLWLKNLPKLIPTNVVEGREARVHRMPPGPDRWKLRSLTFPGIAEAMASQWGELDNVRESA